MRTKAAGSAATEQDMPAHAFDDSSSAATPTSEIPLWPSCTRPVDDPGRPVRRLLLGAVQRVVSRPGPRSTPGPWLSTGHGSGPRPCRSPAAPGPGPPAPPSERARAVTTATPAAAAARPAPAGTQRSDPRASPAASIPAVRASIIRFITYSPASGSSPCTTHQYQVHQVQPGALRHTSRSARSIRSASPTASL